MAAISHKRLRRWGVLTTEALVSWARNYATQLEADMTFRQASGGHGWWWAATSPAAESKIRARAYTALDFLDRFAGADSQWAIRARATVLAPCAFTWRIGTMPDST